MAGNYYLVSSKQFASRYFANGVTKDSLRRAPVVAFDHVDDMHVEYLLENFGIGYGSYPVHIVRSSEAFITMAQHSIGYCLIAEKQIGKELKSESLIKLSKISTTRNLYWHRWKLLRGVHAQLSDQIIKEGRKFLKE